MSASLAPEFRYDWTTAEVVKLFELPFNDLMFQAATLHRAHPSFLPKILLNMAGIEYPR